SGAAAGESTYQSPCCPSVVCQRSTPPSPEIRPSTAGSPPSTTSRAPATARRTTSVPTGASVVASRQRDPPPDTASGATNILSGTRATSARVRARNRRSQSGGAASTTTAGAELTSTTNSRASSRGSESATPSNRTSSADQPGDRKRETGNASSVD